MNHQALLDKQIHILSSSNSIDEKRGLGAEILELFKEASNSVEIPVAVKLNAMLALREAIDEFIIHDNTVSRNALENNYQYISNLLYNNEEAA